MWQNKDAETEKKEKHTFSRLKASAICETNITFLNYSTYNKSSEYVNADIVKQHYDYSNQRNKHMHSSALLLFQTTYNMQQIFPFSS